ncbi:hypothetical protein A3A35_01670 [Candidatus Kaiserbacteria bacterium RIFCSPLOWO2_01_FULL_51_21]|uniref:Uncharacterized protein n=1 Tax=Candidatus Kaiserbacteria bacterium RIFCSPLOWO2_01_FULL_51_21 TaxID=1798508 RepID=A0A1F6ED34_9BACT|nr:MAG: hypothetical protein A3A35_01670 [Candidatus Kaiserbacteria bacterium RIFCSPLOWO2_01_FULL_51_21]
MVEAVEVVMQVRVRVKVGDHVRYMPTWADKYSSQAAQVERVIEADAYNPQDGLSTPYWLEVLFPDKRKEVVAARYVLYEGPP